MTVEDCHLVEELMIKARPGGGTVEEIAVLNSALDALNKKVRYRDSGTAFYPSR